MPKVDPSAWQRPLTRLAGLLLSLLTVLTCVSMQAVTPVQGLNPEQRRRADALISVFENGTPAIQYGYAAALHDGRGITAGRAGFTTATGDAYLVVQRYVRDRPAAPLANHLPALATLTAQESDDTAALDGFVSAWKIAARDPVFRAVQDQVVDELYFGPAMRHARTLGLNTALGRTILYDTIIQHGEGDDDDSLGALVSQTTRALGGSPADGIPETTWLDRFLVFRRENLQHPANPATREVWAQSVGRVDTLHDLLRAGSFDLHGPIQVGYGHNVTVP